MTQTATGEAPRILFVDDDTAVCTAFVRAMRGKGFEIDVADSGESALQLAGPTDFAVVATDYRMPSMDGLQLVERLRSRLPDATYLLISGECDLDLALDAVNNHRVSFVVAKPWSTSELVAMLHRSAAMHRERLGHRELARQAAESSRSAEQQRRLLQQAVHVGEARVAELLLKAIDLRHFESQAHCHRVQEYTSLLAETMGVSGADLQCFRYGALLHDVGIIAVPDAILTKQGPLTADEWKIVHRHPEMGASILDGIPALRDAAQIVRQHHERWDGSGYPAGLKGTQICLGARAFALADAIDALLSDRPYRRGVPMDRAADEINMVSGSYFDPEIVEVFNSIDARRWIELREQHMEGEWDGAGRGPRLQ